MSEKWTPEPWVYGFPMQYSTHQDMPATPSPEADQVFLLDGDDYLRTVACVNACVGMADPAKELAALRDQNAAMRKALESLWARAAEFRREAIRIRSTIKAPTDAEMRCNVRAELLERLASEFSLTLATKEMTNLNTGNAGAETQLAALRDQNAAMRNALVQARGALLLDHMVDDDGKPFGTTVVAIEAIDAALATKELTDGK